MENKVYKVGGLFSGVGGIELGFSDKEKFKIVLSHGATKVKVAEQMSNKS